MIVRISKQLDNFSVFGWGLYVGRSFSILEVDREVIDCEGNKGGEVVYKVETRCMLDNNNYNKLVHIYLKQSEVDVIK